MLNYWPKVTRLAGDTARHGQSQNVNLGLLTKWYSILNYTKYPESWARASNVPCSDHTGFCRLEFCFSIHASLILISESISSTHSQQPVVRTSGNKSFWDSTDGGSQMDSKADVRPPRLKPSALIYPLFWLAGHLGEICALKLSHSSDTWNPPGRNFYLPHGRE